MRGGDKKGEKNIMNMTTFLVKKFCLTINSLKYDGYSGPISGKVAETIEELLWEDEFSYLWPAFGGEPPKFNSHRLYYVEAVSRKGDGTIIYVWNRWRDSRYRGNGSRHDNKLP